MSALPQVFQYSEKPVRVQLIDGEPWWVAKDVCEVLGIEKYRDAVSRLDEDERGSVLVDTLGGQQEMTIINEPGLYSLILRSRKAEAKTFKRWITHEVIPAIRKTGGYNLAPALPQDYKSALLALVAQVEEKEALAVKNQALEAKVEADAPKVQFADHVANSINAMSINNAAKVLGTGEIRLFVWLRQQKFLMEGGDHHNRPYQQFIDRGLFKVIEVAWKHPNGENMTSEKTLLTRKGLIHVWQKMKDCGMSVTGQLPLENIG